ncbi:MAG: VPLPA-CTERM-specific exosortase XrtD [Pseudomonadales bacterium]
MVSEAVNNSTRDEVSPPNYLLWGLLVLAVGALGFIFYDGLELMVKWWERDEYSHGYMIPLVAFYLIWQKQEELPAAVIKGSWTGVALLVVGLFVFLMGELSSIYTVIQYAFLLSLFALILSFVGWSGVRVIWVALAYLVFMIPLPSFIYNNLSSELQLISSSLGVFVIRLFDISVYLEGNVIDLGSYQLQVVEACSGLRYLFPLMSFGFLIAYLFKGPIWQKVVLFLSTIPITILMNSFRIGVIGVTVEYWGIEMAEGFLHDFEGWVIFMGCLGVLAIEMWCFHYFSTTKLKFWDRIDLDGPASNIALADIAINWKNQRPFVACLVLLLGAVATMPMLETREDKTLDRQSFNQFPLYYKGWRGRETALEENVLATLKLTDYITANYRLSDARLPVDFYVAYYDSQRKGASIHSPRSCIPGGGWVMTGLEEREIDGVVNSDGAPLKVNRALIRKGNSAQIVYYWFEQRGRNITNEYMAKWYMFWDSMTLNRTDGALLRVVVPVPDIADIAASEQLGLRFIEDFYPLMSDYIPGKEQ